MIKSLGKKYKKIAAQIILRWHIEQGYRVISKSVHKKRIRENADIFDFSLQADDVKRVSLLDTGKRGGLDPEILGTLEE